MSLSNEDPVVSVASHPSSSLLPAFFLPNPGALPAQTGRCTHSIADAFALQAIPCHVALSNVAFLALTILRSLIIDAFVLQRIPCGIGPSLFPSHTVSHLTSNNSPPCLSLTPSSNSQSLMLSIPAFPLTHFGGMLNPRSALVLL